MPPAGFAGSGRVAAAVLGLLLVLAYFGPSRAAATERRVALVVGNTAYEHAPPLTNPGNDAREIAAALQRIGFDEVELHQDLGHAAFLQVLQAFARKAREADLAAIFYSGHGLEVAGRNFLIPTDAKLVADDDVEFEAVPLDLVQQVVGGAKQLRLIVLDACRDNPFASRMTRTSGVRSVGRGLARIEPPGGTLVAYAAKEGQVAEDGDGPDSPFTTALLQHLETPGLEIQFLFRKVRDTVLGSTGNRQEPYLYGSLGGEPYYLVPPAPAPTPRAEAGVASGVEHDKELELAFWRSVEQSRDPRDLETYLREFPRGVFVGLARNRLEALGAPPGPPAASPPAPIQVAPPATKPREDATDREAMSPAGQSGGLRGRRCRAILQRAQLGEPLSDAERASLRKDCAS